MNNKAPASTNADDDSSSRELPQPRELRSEDLLAGAKEVQIIHNGKVYRLRETRNGKLILFK